MSCPYRRGFLAGAGTMLAAGVASAASEIRAASAATNNADMDRGAAAEAAGAEPFHGLHQAGIATAQQSHTCLAIFDLTARKRQDVVALLRAWTDAAARMAAGQTAGALPEDRVAVAPDSAAALGLPPARLTFTFGFGPGLFVKDGVDRYGLAARRPEALIDLPKFQGDELDPSRTGGDLSVQACADDPQVAFHAMMQMAALAYGTAQLRWTQTGFTGAFAPGTTPRNLMGFKDGTNNPSPTDASRVGSADVPRGFAEVVWVGQDGPAWLRGGSYAVIRRIRISLEHWNRTEVDFQEETVGRHKYSGAPLGAKNEFDPLDLDAADKDGNPVIPELSHARLAAPASNDGAQIFRRAYSFNDPATFLAERWPPWRQGTLFDAGLLFIAYQTDPRTGFVRIFETMAKMDALNQFTTHVGSGIFAVPRGVKPGEFVGQDLFA